MKFSVVICTWNRERLLASTLDALSRSVTHPACPWNVVVVDNNSTDGSRSVVRSFEGRLPLRYLFEKTPGQTNARNAALANNAADWIAFTDDDVIPNVDWLERLCDLDSFHEADVVGGVIEPWFRDARPSEVQARVFPETANGFCGVDHGPTRRRLAPNEYVHGANFVLRARTAGQLRFDSTIGHTPSSQGGGDDTEFLNRARSKGLQVWWYPELVVQHYVEPRRLSMPYLRQYTIDKARYEARVFDFGDGPTIFGRPAWVLRQIATTGLMHSWFRLRGDEEASLRQLRKHWTLRGLAAGHAAGSRVTPTSSSP